jgi:transposase
VAPYLTLMNEEAPQRDPHCARCSTACAGWHALAPRGACCRLPEAQRGVVLLPRRWGGERSCTWLARFRRLARDEEQRPETLQGVHLLAFAILLLTRFVTLMAQYA